MSLNKKAIYLYVLCIYIISPSVFAKNISMNFSYAFHFSDNFIPKTEAEDAFLKILDVDMDLFMISTSVNYIKKMKKNFDLSLGLHHHMLSAMFSSQNNNPLFNMPAFEATTTIHSLGPKVGMNYSKGKRNTFIAGLNILAFKIISAEATTEITSQGETSMKTEKKEDYSDAPIIPALEIPLGYQFRINKKNKVSLMGTFTGFYNLHHDETLTHSLSITTEYILRF